MKKSKHETESWVALLLAAFLLSFTGMSAASSVSGGIAGADLTILHSFGAFTNGSNPEAALMLGIDGAFYGTTARRAVFSIAAWPESAHQSANSRDPGPGIPRMRSDELALSAST